MDPEVEERFERIERDLADLAHVVVSVDEIVAKHDEMIAELKQTTAELKRMVSDHDHRLADHDHRLDQLTAIAATFVTDRVAKEKEFDKFRQGLDELRQAQNRTDEELGVLIRMMEEWIRSNRRDGQAQ